MTVSNNDLTSLTFDTLFAGFTSLERKYFHEALFVKVFHHHVDKGPFANNSEVMISFEEGKFSILKYVNELFQFKGKYEMLIECPNPSPGIVWWRQSQFPNLNMNIEKSGNDVEGFVLDPHTTWSNLNSDRYFTGLSRSNSDMTLFDGTSLGNWWFAIGAKSFGKGIPCRDYGSEISLWVRIPGLPESAKKS